MTAHNTTHQPTTTAPADARKADAAAFLAAVEDALHAGANTTPTAYRDETPVPAIGTTPPVAQPGRPPMGSKATDDSVRMIAAGFLTLCTGAAASGVLHYSGDADPVVIGLIAVAPISIAVPILALSRLMRRATQAAEAAPATHHHHYAGTVQQDHRTVNQRTSGVWVDNTTHN